MGDNDPVALVSGGVAIPSKPGQRLQYPRRWQHRTEGNIVAIPSKPGQRLQSFVGSSAPTSVETLSQSLPNQVNDFNMTPAEFRRESSDGVAIPSKPGQRLQLVALESPKFLKPKMSQSLPNQVNDFNRSSRKPKRIRMSCRNPFQTRSTTSIPSGFGGRNKSVEVSQSLPN